MSFPPYLIAFLCAFFCLSMIFHKKSGHFFKSLMFGSLGGISALLAVGAVGQLVTLTVGVNWLTVAVAAMGSVPGVIMLLAVGSVLG